MIVSRLKRAAGEASRNFRNDIKFSKRLAVRRLVATMLHRLRIRTPKLDQRIHAQITAFLKNSVAQSLHRANAAAAGKECLYSPSAPVWVCWWQGEAQAPALVKQCIKSIKAHSGTHPVIIICQENYLQYLDIPEYILAKVEAKQMCMANFSDYIRFSLLEKYGGLWLDATIFVPGALPEECFTCCFFTCNAKPGTGFLSDGRWTSFCIGGWSHSTMFSYMKAAFEEYWQKNDTSIDYLLVDYLMDIGYQSVPEIKAVVDSLPLNNQERNHISAAMVKGLPASALDDLISGSTFVYKLSWRENYPTTTVDGRATVYSAFLERNWP